MGKNGGAEVSKMYEAKVRNKKNATVIPAPRKSEKRMVFESMLHFFLPLFSSAQRALASKINDVSRTYCS
ncbi:hypothetical protein VNO80_18691 [Phaseolus coccineus]|uniref:Uncharacterized protein n=1 Tax=Phaseolus coccineus TaxID=3886 RepID=A0AAN9ME85_PHACN